MPNSISDSPILRATGSIADIEARAWDACANPEKPHSNKALTINLESESQAPESKSKAFESVSNSLESSSQAAESFSQEERYNPFISHAFLSALEASQSVGPRTGWTPLHLTAHAPDGTLIGAAPTYLKSHSMGEYVFDHAWADAYERAGESYYPKLQVAVPFTPVTGRRLLLTHGKLDARPALINGLNALMRQTKASSLHITFLTADEQAACAEEGMLARTGQQFHFFNPGYRDFDDFLSELSSRKRKMIRKEREQALSAGIEIEHLTGTAISQKHWDAFYAFYIDTGSRKWGRPYLTRAFFDRTGETMADDILLVMAKRGGKTIAGAINFIGADALYGRNWGAIEDHPCLHFEACYYQAIDFAIAKGLKRVEAGAQGEHKLARGYRPVVTYSAHAFADPRLERAVANFLTHERAQVDATIEIYGEHVPFKKGS